MTELLSPARRRRTLLLWIVSFGFLWASNGILFMLPTILTQRGFPLSQAITFQLVQAIAACFGYSACGLLIDRFGRRPVLFLYFFIGAFCHLWFAEASGVWLYVAAAAVGWVNPGVYGATGVYVSELYPTHLRATAVGWFFGIGRIGSFLAPAVVGLMLSVARANMCCTPSRSPSWYRPSRYGSSASRPRDVRWRRFRSSLPDDPEHRRYPRNPHRIGTGVRPAALPGRRPQLLGFRAAA